MFGRLCSLILLTNLYSNNGCLVLQNSRYCKLKVPLLQARTALSAFLTKWYVHNMPAACIHYPNWKSRLSEPCPKTAILMYLNYMLMQCFPIQSGRRACQHYLPAYNEQSEQSIDTQRNQYELSMARRCHPFSKTVSI